MESIKSKTEMKGWQTLKNPLYKQMENKVITTFVWIVVNKLLKIVVH